jgi:hypothetical protein
MNWNDILTALGGITIVTAALGVGAKIAIQHFLAGDLEKLKIELKEGSDVRLATLQGQLNQQRDALQAQLTQQRDLVNAQLAANTAENDRIRQEIDRWSNQVVGAIDDLRFRLENIIRQGSNWALSNSGQRTPNQGEWKIDYQYFLPSTIFLFAQYFCWIRLLEEEGSFELFEGRENRLLFFKQVRETERKLSSWPLDDLKEKSDDFQVFRFQQRGLGGALVVGRGNRMGCMRYSEFLEKWNDPIFSIMVKPMRQFLEDIKQSTRRWERLALMRDALAQLRKDCDKLLEFKPLFPYVEARNGATPTSPNATGLGSATPAGGSTSA